MQQEFSFREAAEMTGYSYHHIRQLAKDKVFEFREIDRFPIVNAAAIEKIKEHKRNTRKGRRPRIAA